ncbi:hypothetical protein SAMN05216403_1144 [Nitrosospira multiformis ATCC 25196]|uniref:Uncharacterized protein n=1 Tax=Nitrosospira multiformis (strain ATCC 25196 / NCIMB 11849 / C 71) TaxID=323848 RepID=A0A1H5VSC6_NITMU|nr:hypothetical protein SAMN05216403_1144 [Nitrosospira multiformis ATCC 25196]
MGIGTDVVMHPIFSFAFPLPVLSPPNGRGHVSMSGSEFVSVFLGVEWAAL